MLLNIENIEVSIGKKALLESISFSGEKGQLIALIGPNGAGKSTLLKVISGDIPYKGVVTLHQTDTRNYNKMQLAQVKAVLGQKSNVQFDFTVEEVTLMGRYPHFQHRPCENDFAIVKKYHECLDLREYCQRSHTSLSGGEQQRNQFARVLAQLDSDVLLAKLLLLDEPLNNLDIKYQYQFMDFAKQFANKGNLVILVIHDLNIAAEYADKIVLLNEGKLFAQGTPEEVLTKSNLEACYDLPVFVSQHPYKSQPMVLFNLAAKEEIQNNQTITIYN